MTCQLIRPNVCHIGNLHLVSILTIIITAVDISFCTSLRNFIQVGPPTAEKMTSCRFSWWGCQHFRGPVMGSLKSLCTTSYMSSIETTLNCLVFEKIAFFAFWRQINKQVYRRRYESRRPSKPKLHLKKLKKLIWWKRIFNMADAIFTTYNVACGSGIMTVNSPSGSTLHDTYVALKWHATEFAQTSAILEFYIWFRYHRSRHVTLHQTAKFYPNRTTLDRKKWRHVDFQYGGSQPSWILGVP